MNKGKPEAGAISRFFRSLSVMMSAGIPIHQSLVHLSEARRSDLAMTQIASQMAEQLYKGHRLSHALASFPQVFDKFGLTMIRVGEKSGSLERVLRAIAEHQEWVWGQRQKLKSALV